MEWLTGNSFFALLLLVCIGMHFFGHGHGSHGADTVKKKQGDHDHKRREI